MHAKFCKGRANSSSTTIAALRDTIGDCVLQRGAVARLE